MLGDGHCAYASNSILPFTEYCSRYVEAFPLQNTQAVTIARILVNEICFRFSPPQYLLSDLGSNFISEVVKETCKLFGIERISTSPCHPQQMVYLRCSILHWERIFACMWPGITRTGTCTLERCAIFRFLFDVWQRPILHLILFCQLKEKSITMLQNMCYTLPIQGG